MVAAKKTSKVKKQFRFVIKCKGPVSDEILDLPAYEKFLVDRIKVNGKTGLVGGENVTVSSDKKTNEVIVLARPPFSKRYIKYLTKKFLRKNQLRDYIRVIADSKYSFDLRYFNVNGGADADEE